MSGSDEGGRRGPGAGSGSRVRRDTLVGVACGGLLFTALGLWLDYATGFSPGAHPGPLAMLALVGATVGGLVGPMLGGLIRRRGPDGEG